MDTRIDKKRLLIFHPTIAPYRIDLFNSLYKGFDTRVCLFYRNLLSQKFDYSKIESQFQFCPVYLKRWIQLFGRAVYGGVWKNLEDYRPDIVIVNEFSLCAIQVLIYKLLYCRHFRVVSLCDDSYSIVADHNDFSLIHRIARRLIVPFLDDLVLVEPRVVKWYQDHFHKGYYFPIIRDDDNARDIYNRVLHRSIQIIDEYNLKDKYVFLFVGRLVAIKNVDTIIEAYSYMNRNDCVLVIIGEGKEKPFLESLSRKIENRVIFTGRLEGDDLYLWYNVADCFVLASYQEPFGAVTNEALLAGCWCLVSEKAGSQSLIRNGVNGYTFIPRSVKDLKEKMALSFEHRRLHNHNVLRNNLMCEDYHQMVNELICHLYEI